ncbi:MULTISPECIES: aspartyl protease family protein [Desulfosporosinus]|uniref:Aspartyl protease n=2 Tax=Desulfosporosinus TaxID=79206 RepID=A0A1G8FNU7_9FIRM|nr:MULTISPECIES: aspartyl protease family protein [Desulfosporosinus]MDO0824647.1 aspartyl protease family protein [Desulfosporosinus nitroreducens]SDH83754.1 Aspartyl protease [Desulfosporosinus hippei DSM 8344]
MNMKFQDGLLFTSIQISFRGNTKVIENIVIDTGAAETIISPDAVEDIGIFAELEDSVNSFYGVGGSLHNFFSKNVVKVKLGEASLEEVKMDFGVIDPQGNINGLLGLDLLMELGAVIDLRKLSLTLDAYSEGDI